MKIKGDPNRLASTKSSYRLRDRSAVFIMPTRAAWIETVSLSQMVAHSGTERLIDWSLEAFVTFVCLRKRCPTFEREDGRVSILIPSTLSFKFYLRFSFTAPRVSRACSGRNAYFTFDCIYRFRNKKVDSILDLIRLFQIFLSVRSQFYYLAKNVAAKLKRKTGKVDY